MKFPSSLGQRDEMEKGKGSIRAFYMYSVFRTGIVIPLVLQESNLTTTHMSSYSCNTCRSKTIC